jgi:uncharacterized protein YjcR
MDNDLKKELRDHLVDSRRLLEYAAIERCRRMMSVRFPFNGYLHDSFLDNQTTVKHQEKHRISINEITSDNKDIVKQTFSNNPE